MSKSLSWSIFWLCLAALLSLGHSAFAGDAQWVEVHSPHFSVVTDAGEKRARETALKFEQMRAVFGAMLSKAKVGLPIPLQIVAFRNTKEFRQFAPLWHGKPTQLAGLFQSGMDRDFILLDMSVEDPWTVVFHEYAHELMNGNVQGERQAWFEEGFAEYFSSIQVDGKQAKLGYRPPPGDLEALQQLGLLKVSDLFRVQHDSQTYNEGDRRSLFYAESWLVVHYLYDTQQIPKVGTYFDAIDQKLSIDDAIQRAFGMSAAQFDKTLRNYLSAGRIRYITIPTPPGIETAGYSAAPMTLPDARAVMADVHLHSLDYLDKAVNEFEAILAADPNNAAALRGLGYAALRKQDFPRAGDYFRKAVQADSKDPRVFYYSALLWDQENSLDHDSDALANARKNLEKSIALDPNFADAYALLAQAHMRAGQDALALASMQKALELSPRNEQYLFNFSQMYLAMGKVDQATQILTRLTKSANPEVAQRARDSLQQVGTMQVVLHAMSDHASPQLVARADSESGSAAAVPEPVVAADVQPLPATAPPKFLKGQLLSVDCSHAPVAVLTVVAGAKTFKLKVPDTKEVAVIGADNFSCDWSKKNVALNYQEAPSGEADVLSVEIQ